MAEKIRRGDLCFARFKMGKGLEQQAGHGMAACMSDPVILWFRQDLRIRDNPALAAAAKAGNVRPVFILEDQPGLPWRLGGATLKAGSRSMGDQFSPPSLL